MLTVLTANGPSGYSIANSLRFRSSASAYLNRTQSAGSQTTWTWSGWVKRGVLSSGASQYLLQAGGSFGAGILFLGADTLQLELGNGSSQPYIRTSAVLRDPSAWYHIVAVADTTNATAANRLTLYVNGVLQVLGVTDYPAQNYAGYVNQSGVVAVHGRWNGGPPNRYFDGYMAEINFIDGQALTPSSFGEIDSTTGVWKAKRYTGTYGTNGFRLNFSNGTSTTTLGYDSSGNGNNWTTNNISLTAGSTYDWMIDSPTKFPGSSYGVGNYAVLNPLDHTASSYATLSNANLTCLGNTSTDSGAYAGTISVNSGIWYWEVTRVGTGGFAYAGVTVSPISSYANAEVAISQHGVNYRSDGPVGIFGVNGPTLATWNTNGDVIMVALDMTNGAIYFGKNGTWLNSGVPTSGASRTGAAATWTAGTYTLAPAGGGYQSGNGGNYNFGQRPFAYTPPSGYKSLCTQNLPGVTIQNGAGYMAATTYTGNGTSQSIVNTVNGVSFQPNFVWVKSRSLVAGHELVDSVRGAAKTLYSNLTNAEDTTSQTVTAFNSNGFSVGADTGANSNGATQIAWQWKAGGTAVTNTAGSITSSVSANPTAGFSVVTFTNVPTANSPYTVGHGLGVAPSFYIIKARSYVGNWDCYHSALGNNADIRLNLTNAVVSPYGGWQTTSPTSSVFTINGSYFSTSTSDTFVAYCFAAIPGYSAFGSYTGNGSSDGPFVYCGFRPAFVLIKGSSFVSNWFIEDQARNGYNVNDGVALRPNLSNAEDGTTTYNLDLLSNGFKLRSSAADSNTSSATFIWAAFASNPFQNALAR